jgi:starch synthase
MKSKLKIFFVSPEVAPFARTGELAEFSAALPGALKNRGHEVRVMMPNYRSVNERKHTLRDVIRLKEFTIPVGNQALPANVKSAFLPDSKVQVYLLNYKPYFDRDGLYQNSAGSDYHDNADRFIFFGRGCLETLKLLQWQPDIIHCNDWQTALIPVYLKTLYKNDPFFKDTAVVLTVHDISYQGIFEAAVMAKTGLPADMFCSGSNLEFYGKVNFLKAGLLATDCIATLSRAYAEEIQSAEYGKGLEGVVKARRQSLAGILSGVNYAEWDPETDRFIAQKYSANNLGPKIENKQELLKRVDLSFAAETPVLGMISRLESEKGFDLLEQAFDAMMALGVQIIVLGTGEEKYQKMLARFAKKYARQLAVHFRFDHALAHLLQAGADMLLMPSHDEPGGVTQLQALRYGTIPLVYAAGSLAETVQNYDPKTESGAGFVFKKYAPDELVKTLERALKIFQDKKRWPKLMKNAMKQEFSLEATAEQYTKLFARLAVRGKK